MSQRFPFQAVTSLGTLYIVRMLGLFMVLPVLALAGDDYSESTPFLLGVALGIYGLTQALLQIPFGVLSDRWGRKPVILIGLLLFGAGSLVAATADHINGLIIGRALQGAGAIAGVVIAMVGDLTPTEYRTRAMAVIGASIGAAFALSLVIGPFLVNLNAGSIKSLFWAALILSLVGIVVLYIWVPKAEQSLNLLNRAQLKAVLANHYCWPLYLGVFVLHFILMGLFVVVPTLLESFGLLRSQHAWVYLSIMALAFIAMVPLMLLSERKGAMKSAQVFALGLLMAGVCLLSFAGSLWVLLALLAVFFIGFNFMEASMPSLLTRLLPTEVRGAGSGIFATCQFLGAACGGIIGGWLLSTWGANGLFVISLVLVLVWLLVVVNMQAPALCREGAVVR